MRRSFLQPKEKHYLYTSHKTDSQNYSCSPMENVNPKIHRSQQSQSTKSVDFDDLLTIQLDQLKHENQFLKKKLQDAMREKRELLMQGFGAKPKRNFQKRPKRQIQDNIQLSLDFFFKQIKNLINNIKQLFKISLNIPQECQLSMMTAHFFRGPIKSHVMQKQILFRKLERITISQENQRYPMILDLFTDYYRTKTQTQKNTVAYVDQMTDRALQLSKWMLQKAKNPKRLSSVDGSEPRKSLQNNYSEKNLGIVRRQYYLSSDAKLNFRTNWREKLKINCK